MLNCTTYVSCEVVEFAVVQPGVPHAGNDLEEQDAEAEHVGLGGEEALESVLRCDVTTGHKKCRSYERRAQDHQQRLVLNLIGVWSLLVV